MKSLNLAHELVRTKGLGHELGPIFSRGDLHALDRFVENGLAHKKVMLGDVAGSRRLPGVAGGIDTSLVVAIQLDGTGIVPDERIYNPGIPRECSRGLRHSDDFTFER